MSLPEPSAGPADDARPRRIQAAPTTTPDWLFSAVIHLLLIALLFTSKAGPGGGGYGNGKPGDGHGDFPNDGWLEAQIGSENDPVAPATIAVDAIANATPVESAVAPPEPVNPVPNPTDPPTQTAIKQTSYVPPVDTPAKSTAAKTSAPGTPNSQTSTGAGAPGPGRSQGDGSPGDGGHGKGGTSLF